MAQPNPFFYLSDITHEEMVHLQHVTANLNEQQLQSFAQVYGNRRKKPQDVMLLTVLGFLGFAGIQRFVLDQIAMGIVYFLTCGFCFIGTIIDLINYKRMTSEYNMQIASETLLLIQR